jgi:hypothetical protein
MEVKECWLPEDHYQTLDFACWRRFDALCAMLADDLIILTMPVAITTFSRHAKK